jgi:hypothetical protein
MSLANGSLPPFLFLTILLILHFRAVVKYMKRLDFDLSHFERDAKGWLVEAEVKYFPPEDLAEAQSWATSESPKFFYSFNYVDAEANLGYIGFVSSRVGKCDPSPPDQPLRVLDLFAGAGGLSFGLHQAGLHVATAIEYSQDAADNYKHTHGGTDILVGDTVAIKIALQYMVQTYAEQNESTKQFCSNDTRWVCLRFVNTLNIPRSPSDFAATLYG